MNKPVLLVVDDEPDMAELVGNVAQSLGFDVLTTTSVKDPVAVNQGLRLV